MVLTFMVGGYYLVQHIFLGEMLMVFLSGVNLMLKKKIEKAGFTDC